MKTLTFTCKQCHNPIEQNYTLITTHHNQNITYTRLCSKECLKKEVNQ